MGTAVRSLTPPHYLLIAAALSELALLRVTVRIGPFVPPGEAMDTLFSLLQTVGVAALNLLLLLGTVLLAWESLRAIGSGRRCKAVSGALALAAGGAIVAGQSVIPGSAALLASSILFLAALLVSLADRALSKGDTPYPLLPLLSYCALLAYYGLQAGQAFGLTVAEPVALYFSAEALAVAAAIAMPLVYRPPWRPGIAALAAGMGGTFLVLAWARPWILATMVMWNFGFSLWLPLPLYALALGLCSYTIAALAGLESPAPRVAFGLLLVSLGGLKLDYSPYALLALIGFLTLAGPSAAQKPAPAGQIGRLPRGTLAACPRAGGDGVPP